METLIKELETYKNSLPVKDRSLLSDVILDRMLLSSSLFLQSFHHFPNV